MRRHSSAIDEKLETACIYGKLLCELAADVEKLVQFTGLPYGDAVMLVEEVTSLLRGSTWHQFVECGNGNGSPGTRDSPDTGGNRDDYQSSHHQMSISMPGTVEKSERKKVGYDIEQSKSKVETNSKLK